MAKSDLGKYMTPSARSFLRAQQPRINVPQRRATIDPSLFKSKPAAGAPLESRQIEAPIQETGPEAMSITDGEASTQPQMITETQQPIESRGSSARYMIQGGGPRIDLSFLVPERANPNYDPNKAIGGENVPYLESKGVGGFFRRLLGDESNRMNIEAQQAQGAEWREARKEAEKEERLLKRIQEANRPIQERFDKELKYRQDKDIRDEIAREDALNLQLAREGEKDVLSDIDMARKELRDAEERALREEDRIARETREAAKLALEERQVKLAEDVANKPRYRTIQTEKGGATIIDELTGKPLRTYHPPSLGMVRDPKTGKESPGTIPGRWEEYGEQPKLPANLRGGGGAQVNRADGSTLGGPLPTVVKPTRSALPQPEETTTTKEVSKPEEAPEPVSEPRYSIWTGRYPGQPEPPLGTLNFETTRKFLGPLGESISGAVERFAKPIPRRDMTNPEMVYNPDAYKAFLRRQMSEY